MSVSSDTEVGERGTPEVQSGQWGRFLAWARRVNLERRLSLFLLISAVGSGIATFAALTGFLPRAGDPNAIILLLNLDLVLFLALGALVARRLVMLWSARKRGVAGARLHARIAGLFAVISVTPAIVVAVFSVVLYDYGLQGWFSSRVSTAVKESLSVAQSYLEEHRQTITADALAMAQDINRDARQFQFNLQRLNQLVAGQAALRALTEAVIFDGSGRILARAGFSLLLDFDPQVPDWALEKAQQGEVVILTAETDDRVRALLRLDALPNSFLYVGRLVDPKVVGHMNRTADAVQLYEQLEGQRSGLFITFALVFVVVCLLLLLATVWVGLAFANHLTQPIGSLITAAERVGAGDLSARVSTEGSGEEVDNLGVAFNRMTSELEQQQEALIGANKAIQERHQFIEAVLGGVSAGVIGLDAEARITLPNSAACDLLGQNAENLRGQKLRKVAPQMASLLSEARQRPSRVLQRELSFSRGDGTQIALLVRVTVERTEGKVIGYVLTFDDVTELISAQRKAAWADVARRIAHEIKNPLTPIQLSAERLKRKYLPGISEDPETFEICADTIIRQVADIRNMVDEFSSFARMPEPVFKPVDLRAVVTDAVDLQREARGAIAFEWKRPEEAVPVTCDAAQVGRALTNLLQNAVDSIEGRESDPEGGTLPAGRIEVELLAEADEVVVKISDNGRGLPKAERHRLTEPYVTTREKGTGLGLAIVKKIMEEHDGELRLEDAAQGGAVVTLTFPRERGTAGGNPPAMKTAKT